MAGWLSGQIGKQVDDIWVVGWIWVDSCIDEWMSQLVDEQIYKWVDGWMDKWVVG